MTSISVREGERAFGGPKKRLRLEGQRIEVTSTDGDIEMQIAFEDMAEITVSLDTSAHINHQQRTEIKLRPTSGQAMVFGSFDRDRSAFYNTLAQALAADGMLHKLRAGRKRVRLPLAARGLIVALSISFGAIALLSGLTLGTLFIAGICGLQVWQVLRSSPAPRGFHSLDDALAGNPVHKAVWKVSIG